VWSVAVDDAPLLPLAVLAGSFCMQTHVPYVGITSGLLALALVALVVHGWRHRAEGGARRALFWGLVAAAVGVVVWFPPILDELRHSPGNLDVLRDYFSDPPEDPIGLRDGAELFLVHLNPWRLVPTIVPESWAFSSSLVPGSVVLGVWAVAAALSWRLRQRTVSALHLVVAAASVLAVISMSRIFGYVWYYLTLWAWGITTFMILATAWTLALLVGPRLRGPLGGRAVTVATVALAGVVVLWSARFALDATDVREPSPAGSEALAAVAPDTVDALDHGAVPGGGRDGRYLVTWFDPISIGSTGFGLLLELERQGFDVGAGAAQRAAVTPHRVLGPGRATGEVHLAVGGEADAWRAGPGVVEVATFDPRSSEERAEYDRLRRELIERLRAADLADLVPGVDENLFGTSTDPRIPSPAHRLMVRMLELGLPTSVFVAPPGGEPARG
jgi:MFS family permease